MTFWEKVHKLREQNHIPRQWKREHLHKNLDGQSKSNTINTVPSNSSISREGDEMGNYVKNGQAPKAWRVGRGLFELIADPDDDPETQQAETRRAHERAEELRAKVSRGDDRQARAAALIPVGPERPRVRAEASPRSADIYPSVAVTLTEDDRRLLAGLSTEEKALHIVKKHLRDRHGSRADIRNDGAGADLKVTVDGRIERIEVKGTESASIAWPQLKVSSQNSHDALASRAASIYRVVGVSGARPRIYFLEHGRHFTLEPEARWAVRRVAPKDDRYPLRGEPYGYERPFDPVAEDDWEALE